MKESETENPKTDQVAVVLAEYRALRVELMYFIDQQRKMQQLILTVAIGQASALLASNVHFAARAFGLAILFLAPIAIMTLMTLQLEATARIILIADYIHKGIKRQLADILDNARFFEWEEHKARTSRVARWLLKFLDATKWAVFLYGLVASFVIGGWILIAADHARVTNADKGFLAAAFLCDLILAFMTFRIASAFNEVDGESLQKDPDKKPRS
ncbi:hypothetical protein [Acidiferrobacter sp.]|uniref:hypothetical protein n=1 Tax=Acidiferrobacter sp. TaxID=1872107 RepID=UPI002625F2BB|nr:hypothetical protein [Acidiferrobacter sp.]